MKREGKGGLFQATVDQLKKFMVDPLWRGEPQNGNGCRGKHQ